MLDCRWACWASRYSSEFSVADVSGGDTRYGNGGGEDGGVDSSEIIGEAGGVGFVMQLISLAKFPLTISPASSSSPFVIKENG